MNAFDRRRIAVASLITVSVLALIWVFSGSTSNGSGSNSGACVGCDAGNSAPSTTRYVPFPPLFVGGDNEGVPLDPVSIATAPAPNSNEILTTATFGRFNDSTDAEGNPVRSIPRCSTMLAPESALLTVTNVDNGQSTTCTNTQGFNVPPNIGIVIGTDVFAKIGDLANAPLPVRVSWEPEAADSGE